MNTTSSTLLILFAFAGFSNTVPAAEQQARTLTIDFASEMGPVNPRTGFLGGLRDTMPDDIIKPLNPSLWRTGHQFRGRIASGLTGAVDRVEALGATYKLVMSDLINSKPGDFQTYEADVKKLVTQVGHRSSRIIWEPVNEPDCSHKPIETYYELYAHAFKALRAADPKALICGPGFAFPSYDKYKAFLEYCRSNNLECNYLSWHYTGWDPSAPEAQKWQLGRLREFLAEFKDQKIIEIHCDEWGAGPDKPGRLQPGRAVVWFYYLEDIYKVDRACRANWGKEDDYLGGIITTANEQYPVYSVYRFYGSTKGQTRVAVEGNNKTMAALASKSNGCYEILLGSVERYPVKVTLDIKCQAADKLTAHVNLIAGDKLEGPLPAKDIPSLMDFTTEKSDRGMKITLPHVEENQAYRLTLSR